MNRLQRLTSILIQLQSKRINTAQELAEKYGVSLRTIYRDMSDLQESGVPIGSEAGIGYYLVKGYSLPPVSFTEDEANALITAGKLLERQSDSLVQEQFESALTKIRAVLKSTQKDKAERLSTRIVPSKPISKSNRNQYLTGIQHALSEFFCLSIEYKSLNTNEITSRIIEPFGLYFTEQNWVLIAHCRLRNDIRQFRVDFIQSIEILKEKSLLAPQFDLKSYFKNR